MKAPASSFGRLPIRATANLTTHESADRPGPRSRTVDLIPASPNPEFDDVGEDCWLPLSTFCGMMKATS